MVTPPDKNYTVYVRTEGAYEAAGIEGVYASLEAAQRGEPGWREDGAGGWINDEGHEFATIERHSVR